MNCDKKRSLLEVLSGSPPPLFLPPAHFYLSSEVAAVHTQVVVMQAIASLESAWRCSLANEKAVIMG